MPTKEQQDAINKAQLEIMGETLETKDEVIAGIKEDFEKKKSKDKDLNDGKGEASEEAVAPDKIES